MTLAALLSAYAASGTPPRSRKPRLWWRRWGSAVKRIPAPLLQRSARRIERAEIEALRDGLISEGYAPATGGETVLAVSAAYAWALDRGTLRANPCRGVHIPPARELTEHLERGDVERLLLLATAIRPDLVAPLALACYAGLRHGELAALHWEDLHHQEGVPRTLHVCRSWDGATEGPPKNGEEGWCPIGVRLAQVLTWWRPLCPGEVLVCPAWNVPRWGAPAWGRWHPSDMRGIRELLDELDLPQPERPWHFLRHTCATLVGGQGGTQLQIAALLRHRDPASAERYIHLVGDPSVRDLVDQLGTSPAPGRRGVQLAPEQLEDLAQRVAAILGPELARLVAELAARSQ